MPRAQSTFATLRAAAAWLLMASVLVGPLGIGASVASAAAKTCGVSCPCEDVDVSAHADDASDGEACTCADTDEPSHAEAERHDEFHADACPDDCPDCNCCPGVMLGVVGVVAPRPSLPSHVYRISAPPEAPALGASSCVFRPPRSLV